MKQQKLTIKQEAINNENWLRDNVQFDQNGKMIHDANFTAWITWAAFLQTHYKITVENPTPKEPDEDGAFFQG